MMITDNTSFREHLKKCRLFTEFKELTKQAVRQHNFVHVGIIRHHLTSHHGQYMSKVVDAWVDEYKYVKVGSDE